MQTLKQIRDDLDTQYPVLTASVNGEDIQLSATERKEKLDEWAKNIYDKAVAEKAVADAKADILNRLGITADEAKLLLS